MTNTIISCNYLPRFIVIRKGCCVYEKISRFLQEKGFEVYSVGEHKGFCKTPYLVIKDKGQKPYSKTNVNFQDYEIIVFYPFGTFFQVQPFINQVVETLSQLPFLKYSQNQTPTVIDPEVRAYTTSLTYTVYKQCQNP